MLFAAEFEQRQSLKVYWSFDGIFGKFDKQAIQRGYQVYKEVCSSCHSVKRIAFRNLEQIGLSRDEVKELSASYKVTDGPNDEGDLFERRGLPSDYFVSPFANKQAAMASNNGSYPPDLSLMVKARHDGANYVYSLLTGYTGNTDDNNLYINPFFNTGKLAMAPPFSQGLIEYTDGTEATINNMAYDVVNFLQWTAEPEMEERKRIGFKVVLFLFIATILLMLTKHRTWKDVF